MNQPARSEPRPWARSSRAIGLVAGAWLLWAIAAARAQAAQTVTVDIQNFASSPATLTIQVGDTVTWTNLDDTMHSATSDAGAPVAFDTGALTLNQSASVTFAVPGTYPYHCSFHRMNGTIVVEGLAASSSETAPSSVAGAPSSPGIGGSQLPGGASQAPGAGQLPDGATSDGTAGLGLSVAALGALLVLALLSVAAARGSRDA